MSEAIEFEKFASTAKLPEGLRFKEWTPGQTLTYAPAGKGEYLSTMLFGIERITDGVVVQTELSYLNLGDRKSAEENHSEIMVRKADLENAVAKAIAELGA